MLGEAPFSDGFGTSSAHRYAESMREAHRLSQRAMQRTEIANNALLRGNDDYGNIGDNTNPGQGLKLNVDLAKFAAELNAVDRTKTVALAAEDLQQPFQECSRLTDRYFPPLHFGARESYPLPTPQSMAVEDSGLDGSIRCERGTATIFLPTPARKAQNIHSCWSRQAFFSSRRSPGRQSPKLPVWVPMQWDEKPLAGPYTHVLTSERSIGNALQRRKQNLPMTSRANSGDAKRTQQMTCRAWSLRLRKCAHS